MTKPPPEVGALETHGEWFSARPSTLTQQAQSAHEPQPGGHVSDDPGSDEHASSSHPATTSTTSASAPPPTWPESAIVAKMATTSVKERRTTRT